MVAYIINCSCKLSLELTVIMRKHIFAMFEKVITMTDQIEQLPCLACGFLVTCYITNLYQAKKISLDILYSSYNRRKADLVGC